MLRSTLIYLSRAAWAKKIVTQWPIAWRAASRFIAGEKLEDGIRVIQELNKKGIYATLDHLGENTTTEAEAVQATQDIHEAIKAIEKEGLSANVSVKLSQIGLVLDKELCARNLTALLTRAREARNFIRIDMEDSPWVDQTLGMYRRMRNEQGFDHVGVVIQSYLYRSEEDVRKLAAEGGRVRLCKGAYKEPPEVAYPKKSDVDASYDRLTSLLIDGALHLDSPEVSPDGRFPPMPGIATHDAKRIEYAVKYARQVGLSKRAMEFQMLHGIRRDLQEQMVKEGYPVRVYVPYGSKWYPYFMRRLAERPANIWFFVSNYFRK